MICGVSKSSRGFKPILPMIEEEDSGELLWESYQVWWGPRLAVTRSQYMFLKANTALYRQGKISPAAASLNEMWFALYGWLWADAPDRNRTNPFGSMDEASEE